MATIVDTLVLALKFDVSPVQKGRKDADEALTKFQGEAEKRLAAVEKASLKTADAVQTIGKQALTLFAILLGGKGLAEFTDQVTKANVALGITSLQVGLNSAALTSWGIAAATMGGSAEATAASLGSLADKLMGMNKQGAALPLAFQQLMNDTGGKPRFDTAAHLIDDVATALQKLAKTNPQLASFYGRQIGIDPATIAAMEKYGPGGDNKFAVFAPTPEMISRSNEMLAAWVTMAAAGERFGQALMFLVSPEIIKTLGFLEHISEYMAGVGEGADLAKKQKDRAQADQDKNDADLKNDKRTFFQVLSDWARGDFSVAGPHASLGGAAQSGALGATRDKPVMVQEVHPPGQGGEGQSVWSILQTLFGSNDSSVGVGTQGGTFPGATQGNASGGGGTYRASGDLAANQKAAYAEARAEGLSDTAARALVAAMSGESLANPHDYHWDGTHMAAGAGQWDPLRSARIAGQFGKPPQQMDAAESMRATIWEMKNFYPEVWNTMQNAPTAGPMIDDLVRHYYIPANKDLAISQRLGYLRGLPADMNGVTAGPASPASGVPPHANDGNPKGWGHNTSSGWLYSGVSKAKSARDALVGMGAGSISTDNSTRSHEVNVGQVSIVTQATDSKGIAGSFADQVKLAYMAQAGNYGPV